MLVSIESVCNDICGRIAPFPPPPPQNKKKKKKKKDHVTNLGRLEW